MLLRRRRKPRRHTHTVAPRIPEDGSGRTTPVGNVTELKTPVVYDEAAISIRATELSRVYPTSVTSKPVMSTSAAGRAANETLFGLLASRNVNGAAGASVVPGAMGTKYPPADLRFKLPIGKVPSTFTATLPSMIELVTGWACANWAVKAAINSAVAIVLIIRPPWCVATKKALSSSSKRSVQQRLDDVFDKLLSACVGFPFGDFSTQPNLH